MATCSAGLLAGCATANWYQAGADEAQVRRDLRGCEAVAARRYHERLPRAEVAATEATPAQRPDDELGRQTEINRLVRECMLALGYEPLAAD